MANYSSSKQVIGDVFPINGMDTTWSRTEPLITAEELEELHLFGIPLVSGMVDPNTNRRKRMSPLLISKNIDRAVSLVEIATGVTIFPQQFKEKKPWDRQEYDSFGYFVVQHRPVMSVEAITVNLSNNDDIYEVPPDWIEVGNAQWGQINIIPLTVALTSGNAVAIPTTAGGALLLSIFQGKSQWVASFWQIVYTCGFPDGKVPKIINELIGTVAAIETLSQLAATYGKSSGTSISLDGMSQSVSTPGPEIFTKRVKDLQEKKAELVGKVKNLFHLKIFSNNV